VHLLVKHQNIVGMFLKTHLKQIQSKPFTQYLKHSSAYHNFFVHYIHFLKA
jgi:hypothetical protein